MKNLVLVCFILLCVFTSVKAQWRRSDVLNYLRKVDTADSLYCTRHYIESAELYSNALHTKGIKILKSSWYESARVHVLVNKRDSALVYLSTLAFKYNYSDLDEIINEKDFYPLHTLPSWLIIINKIKLNKENLNKNVKNPKLATELLYRLHGDQAVRQHKDTSQVSIGISAEEYNFRKNQDSVNYEFVKKIIKDYGWPGKKMIGEDADKAMFLFIIHSDNAEKINSVLPAMRKAAKTNQTNKLFIAYLEDRVAMRLNKEQVYGTQFTMSDSSQGLELYKLKDPLSVDLRRYSLGMPPLQVYVRLMKGQRPH